MRPRRALVRAVMDCAAVPAATAAAASASLRCLFHATLMAQAHPRRRSSKKKTEAAKAAKRTKSQATLKTPEAVGLQEAEGCVEPLASETTVAEVKVPLDGVSAEMRGVSGREDLRTARAAAAAPSDEVQTSAGESLVHEPVYDTADGDNATSSKQNSEAPAAAAASVTAMSRSSASLHAEQHRVTALRRRLLVGAHAALEGTADCPDPRAVVPRFSAREVVSEEPSEPTETATHRGAVGGALLCVQTPAAVNSKSLPKNTNVQKTGERVAPLSMSDAIDVFANAFALTLHSLSTRQRMLAATTTAPVISTQGTTSAATPAAAAQAGSTEVEKHNPLPYMLNTPVSTLSFLASPFAITASQVLANRSPFYRTTAMEGMAPLQWLETSFVELCRRAAQELRETLAHEVRPSHHRSISSAKKDQDSDDKEAARTQLGENRASVGDAVRTQASLMLSALERTARCVGSHSVFAMRRQWRRDVAAAASSRKRKSRRSPDRSSADAEVRDTLINTVDRVGLELHLVHVSLARLCEEACHTATTAADASTAAFDTRGRATPSSVEVVIRQAFSWSNSAAADGAAAGIPSAAHLQWMLATAMLEQIHVQSYNFHHSSRSTEAPLADLANAAVTTKPTYVVESKHLDGLAALVDFALSERDVSRYGDAALHRGIPHNEPRRTTTLLDESLFALFAALHAVLPTYAVLLPAWHRAVASSSSLSERHDSNTQTSTNAPSAGVVREQHVEEKHVRGTLRNAAAQYRDKSRTALPTAVWDVVAEHWAQHEETVRQEGSLAAVWWLRLLPLWMNTATSVLQLHVVATVLASDVVDSTDAGGEDRDGDVRRLTAGDVTASLDGLLVKSADLIGDALRFDRLRHERSLSINAASHLRSGRLGGHDAAGMATPATTQVDVAGDDAEDAVDEAKINGNDEGDEGEGEGLLEGGAGVSSSPPPLQRHRGKRSLFYKPHDKESTILQEVDPDAQYSDASSGHGAGGRRSRFVSRVHHRNGGSNSGSSGIAGGSATLTSATAHLSAASQEAHERTSALLDVLVLSSDGLIMLAHRCGLLNSPDRSSALEESWAAAAHTRGELWHLLYALPPAAAVEAALARSRNGTWEAAQVLRGVLPSAILSLLPALDASPTTSKHKKAEGMRAGEKTSAAAADAHHGGREERALRRVVGVLARAQELLGLAVFEALDHLLVALSEVLLRIQDARRDLYSSTVRRRDDSPAAAAATAKGSSRSPRGAVRRDKACAEVLSSVITIGATTMLAGNPLLWESMNAVWQLQQLRYRPGTHASSIVGQKSGPQRPGKPAEEAAVASVPMTALSSAAAHSFAVQWTAALTKEIPFVVARSRQQSGAVAANAREILRVLQTPSLVAALPLYARQVSMAALLQSLSALSSRWRYHNQPASASAFARAPHSPSRDVFTVAHAELLEMYQGLLAVLTADADLRLLCCYAGFVEGLYEVHLRLKADHAALIAWADEYLLPLVLPVVVAGLRRSQSLHNAAAHADLCETTLVLLSPLSRFAANPQVAMSDVLRSRWNQILLQVSLYCVRVAGRGGSKRATDYGMPPVVLPNVAEAEAVDGSGSPSQVATAKWWSATFTHGAEPIFLSLLDHSNAVLKGFHHGIEPRDIDAADGVRAALAAYVATWHTQVRFGRRNWDRMMAAAATNEFSSAVMKAENDTAVAAAAMTAPAQALLARWKAACAAAEAFSGVTLPARMAGAEAMPFLASKPTKARQLGYLVRFMEHYLREQERLSRLSDEEMQALLTADTNATARIPVKAALLPTSTSSLLAADARAVAAPLSDTAPLVLLDFVGHLTSAGDWGMVTWSCNIAETVVKIELKRHRHIPAAARTVAATAILSQIRAVPPPVASAPLSANVLKSLLALSDIVSDSPQSLLGFARRCPNQGLLCHPTRDQYRVLTFGLKQAMAYVRVESLQYRACQGPLVDPLAPGDGADVDGAGELGLRGDEAGEKEAEGDDANKWAMCRKAGKYYAATWSTHVRALEARQQQKQRHTQATAQPSAVLVDAANDPHRDFSYYVICLISVVDACMESAQLYLVRQQGDGEEDIRAVIEAAVIELCRTLTANIQAVLSLTGEQRQTCFHREEAELLWASLCVVAAIGTVAPRDPKERVFTPRCTHAVHRAFDMTQRLMESIVSGEDGVARGDVEDVYDETPAATSMSSSRPLCTALVRGVQLLLRNRHCSYRPAIRLAMQGRDRDDLTVVLRGFHVLRTCTRLHEPGRALMSAVWTRLAWELIQPLPAAAKVPAETRPAKEKQRRTPPSATLLVATTVPSRSEYGVVLRDLSTVEAGISGTTSAATSGSGSAAKGPHKTSKAAARDTDERKHSTALATTPFDVTTAMACVVEDAKAILQERQRSLQEEAATTLGRSNSVDVDRDHPLLHEQRDGVAAFEHPVPRVNVAAALESGAVPLSDVFDSVIIHCAKMVRAAGGRATFNVVSAATLPTPSDAEDGGGGGEDAGPAVGFVRFIRNYYQDMVDLLLHVPLRDIVAYPQAEMLFGSLGLLRGAVKREKESELWRLLATKWREELLEPNESTFLALQQAQLALLRVSRGVAADTAEQQPLLTIIAQRGAKGGSSGTPSTATPPPDFFARIALASRAAAGPAPRRAAGEACVSAVAQQAMREHWHPNQDTFPHHDDGRRVVGAAHRSSGGRHGTATPTLGGDASRREEFPGEFDRDATGVAALSAMPVDVPIPVLLTILKTLLRLSEDRSHTPSTLRSRAWQERSAQVTWLAAEGYGGGGGTARQKDGKAPQQPLCSSSAFSEFTEVVLTYTARTFWLLRPRLDDGAWLAWATVERSMSIYPVEQGVRQREWDRVCRQWRLPTNLHHATDAAGKLFSPVERRRISAWITSVKDVCPAAAFDPLCAAGREEAAVYCYIRSLALYLQLLTLSMDLLVRQRILGDLPQALPGVVSRRLTLQRQRRSSSSSGGGGQDEGNARGFTKDALYQELQRLAELRQTQPQAVNRNLLEGATLQYLNVAWCITRHADSLTHLATDVVVESLTGARHSSSDEAEGFATGHRAAILIAYADDVRLMVARLLQDTLDRVLRESYNHYLDDFLERVALTLFSSGFSCDPLHIRLPDPASGAALRPTLRSGFGGGNNTAPAVSVVATLLNASLNASTAGAALRSGGVGMNTAAATAAAGVSSTTVASSLVTRAELFVGSPTMLAVLTPHFVKQKGTIVLQHGNPGAALVLLTSALLFYMSRHNVPLSPLLEAATELLTSNMFRSSATHTFCERLASELTRRKEFREALEPPTIASVDQGAAGSVSNEVVIAFTAAIARQDVHVTKKTLAQLLHFIMQARRDVFGQPPTANRQGKLTLVQVGTTVEATIDTTNPLYTPVSHPETGTPAKRAAGAALVTASTPSAADGEEEDDDAAAVMEAFSTDKWNDVTATTHRKALAALTISLPTVMEVAMHMEAMRTLDMAERRRAVQMLKAADDARRERVSMHHSQAHVAATIRQRQTNEETQKRDGDNSTTGSRVGATAPAPLGKLDASLHLEDPLDFGVAVLHLRYALRKVVHASLRRLLHQQGPRMLAEVASMLKMVDPGMQPRPLLTHDREGAHDKHSMAGSGGFDGSAIVDSRPRPYDGVLAGTTRVLLSRAVLCAQAIGYDADGSATELPPLLAKTSANRATASAAAGDEGTSLDPLPVLKLPVPALQASAVEAAISALGTTKGRHARVGNSSGKIGQLTKEEKAAVHQRVELEREAAVTVGLTTVNVPLQGQRRILNALRCTRRQRKARQQRKEFGRRRAAQLAVSSLSPTFTPQPSSRRSRGASRLL